MVENNQISEPELSRNISEVNNSPSTTSEPNFNKKSSTSSILSTLKNPFFYYGFAGAVLLFALSFKFYRDKTQEKNQFTIEGKYGAEVALPMFSFTLLTKFIRIACDFLSKCPNSDAIRKAGATCTNLIIEHFKIFQAMFSSMVNDPSLQEKLLKFIADNAEKVLSQCAESVKELGIVTIDPRDHECYEGYTNVTKLVNDTSELLSGCFSTHDFNMTKCMVGFNSTQKLYDTILLDSLTSEVSSSNEMFPWWFFFIPTIVFCVLFTYLLILKFKPKTQQASNSREEAEHIAPLNIEQSRQVNENSRLNDPRNYIDETTNETSRSITTITTSTEPNLPHEANNSNPELAETLAISNVQQGMQGEERYSISGIENYIQVTREESRSFEIQFRFSSASSETSPQQTVTISTTQNKPLIAQQEHLSARIQMLERGLSQQQENLEQQEIRTSNLEHNVRENRQKIITLENKTDSMQYSSPIPSNTREKMQESPPRLNANRYMETSPVKGSSNPEPKLQSTLNNNNAVP